MNKNNEILEKLKSIMDPDLGKDIVTLGFVKQLSCDDAGHVSFAIELTTPACPVKEQFKRTAETLVKQVPWVKSVTVSMTAQKRGAPLTAGPGLQGVGTIIAVSSCKGGVGKSTVAVNLAFSLQKLGAKIGIFDADVYGPSLPTMVAPSTTQVFQGPSGLIEPLEFAGAKLMSFGFVNAHQGGGPAIMRGPMVTQVINQLLTQTDWGQLDYLIIDFPPGTGDIQLTLTQLIPITAAVIVTTPQQLAFVDVVKGIQMFDQVKVPVVAVVENMSYFECNKCHEKHHLFGQGARKKLVEQFGIQSSFEIPILPEISRLSDSGQPVVLADGVLATHYTGIADAVVREVSKIKFGGLGRPEIRYEAGRGILATTSAGAIYVIPAAELRRQCRCAACRDEFSGRPTLDPATVADSVFPEAIQPMGNYAIAIAWSDGHTSSVYPYDLLLKLATPA
ncbi:MAG: DUF59 domain-containing protein [Verrucomicrobia bacterium]|nr:MAG: DUF59 domain-containing protein [Verrucomicrobiota bacterium]